MTAELTEQWHGLALPPRVQGAVRWVGSVAMLDRQTVDNRMLTSLTCPNPVPVFIHGLKYETMAIGEITAVTGINSGQVHAVGQIAASFSFLLACSIPTIDVDLSRTILLGAMLNDPERAAWPGYVWWQVASCDRG